MFDELFSLLSPSVEMPLGVDENNNFTPFASAFAVEVPYGLRTATAEEDVVDLSHALTLSVVDSDLSSRLHAVIKGRLRFVASTSTEPSRLELQPLPIHLLLLKRFFRLLPLFKQVLYSNLDSSSVEAAANALLIGQGFDAETVAERVGEFMAGSRRLSVEPGDFIGRPAQDSGLGGRRRLDFMMKDRDGFYLNPAHFLFQWPTINNAIDNHPLLQVLEPVQHSMIFATKSRKLFVFKNSPNPQPPYGTGPTASKTIQAALSKATAGDIVVVLDAETYSENISMPNGVTLTSLGGMNVRGRVGINPTLPVIESPDDDAAVTFEDLHDQTHISGFIITHAGEEGSGILIDNSRKVEVARNKIHGNRTEQGGGIAIKTKSADIHIKQNVITNNEANDFLLSRGQGGGIFITESKDIKIEDNAIYANRAENCGGGIAIVEATDIAIINKNDIGTGVTQGNNVTSESLGFVRYTTNPQGGGGGIGIVNSTRITVNHNTIQHNKASRGGGIELYDICTQAQLTGNHIFNNEARRKLDPDQEFGGDGGGVAVNLVTLSRAMALLHSTVTLEDNVIEKNMAGDDGGGVYATGKALIIIKGANHKINNNEAQLNGGGVRVTFGSKVDILGGEILGNKANVGNDKGGGGGASFSNSSATLKNCVLLNNSVENFAGGGVYFLTANYTGSNGDTYKDLLENAYQFTTGVLELEGCNIVNNSANGPHGAGGGLYVVYKQYPARVKVKETTLSPNAAAHTNPSQRHNVVIISSANPTTLINDDDLPSLNPLTYEGTFTG